MICPSCRSGSSRRSRRRTLPDYLLSLLGMRPWRCRLCNHRFHAWTVPPRYVLFAHCTRCGNLVLQHINGEYVTEGLFLWLWRFLRVPAYCCGPCRYRFFSLRPDRHIEPLPELNAANASPPAAEEGEPVSPD